MPFTFDVTVAKQTPDGIPYNEHVNDYVMLVHGSEKMYVQHGGIYRNGSEKLTGSAVPGWFWDSYRQITPTTRKLVGLQLPEDVEWERQANAARVLDDFDQLPEEMKLALYKRMGVNAPPVKSSRLVETGDGGQAIVYELRTPIQAPGMPVEALKTSEQYEDEDGAGEAPESLVDALQPIRPSFWNCGACGVEVELKKKGVHMARLKRLGRCS